MKSLDDFRQSLNASATGYDGDQDCLAMLAYIEYLRIYIETIRKKSKGYHDDMMQRQMFIRDNGHTEAYKKYIERYK